MDILGRDNCLKRALQLYLQQSPLEALLAELKASAAGAGGGAGGEGLGWTSLPFQQKFATEVVGSPVAERFPPRFEYVARLTKVLLNEVEAAGEEPAEGLLCARVACVASLREGADRDETAFESFYVPPSTRRPAITPRGATTASLTQGGAAGAGAAAEGSGGFDEEREAEVGEKVEAEAKAEGFMSFRVANKDNEVGLRVWEAGRALADFCVAHWRLLEGKRVVELGAGIGMTGIAVAVCCGAREVVLTDYAPRVLANLRFNVEINRPWLLQSGPERNTDAASVTVRSLDWTDYASPLPPRATPTPPTAARTPSTATLAPSATARAPWAAAQGEQPEHGVPEGETAATTAETAGDGASGSPPPVAGVERVEGRSVELNQGKGEDEGGEGGQRRGGGGETDALGVPEVVLAADVVYDVRYHPALVGVVVETLRRCPDALIIFASTLRNAETMAAFHRCLEEAGVPWHNVNIPRRATFSSQQQQQQSAEGTAGEDVAAAADALTLPRKGCASDTAAAGIPITLPPEGCASSHSSRGGGGTSGEASSQGVSTPGVSFEGASCLQPSVSQPGVSQLAIPQPGFFPPKKKLGTGISQPDVSQSDFSLQTNGILQTHRTEATHDRDAERTAHAYAKNSPPHRGERGALNGDAGLAFMLGGSGSGLWCHPGDLERVRFCVCGRGRGLVC